MYLESQQYVLPSFAKITSNLRTQGTFSVENAPSDWYKTFLFPMAVVSSPEKILGKDELSATTSKYMEEDDVLTEAFLDSEEFTYIWFSS